MVEIKEVKTKADRKIFVDLPNRFYMDNPNFVPAFLGDDVDDWDEKKNPAFDYCEARSWLAYKNGKRVELSPENEAYQRAEHLQVVIRDIKELETRIQKTTWEIQKYQKRIQTYEREQIRK